MRSAAFEALVSLRDEFRRDTIRWNRAVPELASLQDELRRRLGYEDYRIETPIVFNEALCELEESSRPAFILVADNPGKKEQLAKNRRYLVGQSGKLAEGFFARELGLDFRRDVIIINKTPIHTAKTIELGKLLALAKTHGGSLAERLETVFEESQVSMASLARRLQTALALPLWISGYGELGPKSLFKRWSETMSEQYAKAPRALRDSVLVFRHFSMNQFAIELKQKRNQGLPIFQDLERIGAENRKRILGW